LLRVSGGSARGRRLKAPRGARPTLGRLKQSLFDMLAWQLPGCRFLDLFAGSGAVGIEALSRGAVRATFVEAAAASVALIRQNLAACDMTGQAEVIKADARQALAKLAERKPAESFDIIFLDPPYADLKVLLEALAGLAEHRSLVTPQGKIIVERSKRLVVENLPEDLVLVDTRTIGDSVLDIIKLNFKFKIKN
jgi:16S rRNA (guanine966-N2)-methyltransferase